VKKMKNMKNMLAGMLALIMVVVSLPMSAVEASELQEQDAVENVEAVTDNTTNAATIEETEEGIEEEISTTSTEDPVVVDIACENIEIIEGGNMIEDFYYDEESGEWISYERYEYYPNCSVTLDDGTIRDCDSVGDFYYNGCWYSVVFSDNQSETNKWGVGVHEVTASYGDVSTTFTVTIIESPVERIDIYDIELIEEEDGYLDSDYNDETGEWDLEFYRYEYSVNGEVYFTDGTSAEISYGSFEYNGEEYYLNYYDGQSYETPWTVGNTYAIKAEVLGQEDEFQITIVEKPVVSFTLEDQVVFANVDGYWETDYNEETDEWDLEYFYYTYPMQGQVVLKDGSVQELDGDWFEYNDEWYYVNYEDGQSYE